MWEELEEEIAAMFHAKTKEAGLKAYLDLTIMEDAPIDEEFVYGEAFPDEGRVMLDVVGPYASDEEIMETICHELVHMMHPEWDHYSNEFEEAVRDFSGM